jgi:lycopene beta-cyclase
VIGCRINSIVPCVATLVQHIFSRHKNLNTRYDYIITGAGCAGLSLLHRMMQHEYFNSKKILLVDREQKNTNDRTWCFWEKSKGAFENIVYYRWKQIDFYSNHFAARYDLRPYEYKLIRSIDLYTTVLNQAKQHANIEIINDEILSIASNENVATVKTTQQQFSANYIFNSIIFEDWKQQALKQKNVHVLLQHFKGWLIETEENFFDERIATFMDFRVDQKHGTTFAYVLPVAKNKALVEYTLFSENILEQEDYDNALEYYIASFLNIKKYSVSHTEFGVIPMTNYPFSKGGKKIINTGAAAGKIKGSSGYTFQFIQKHSAKIIDALLHEKNPLIKDFFEQKRYYLYDGVLLNILKYKKMKGDRLFAQLFHNNSVQNILKFLDNETTFTEDLRIMSSVSLRKFLPATIKQLFGFH